MQPNNLLPPAPLLNIPPDNAAIVPIADCVEPPLTRQPRGRPRKERIRISDALRRQMVANRAGVPPDEPACPPPRCSTCCGTGHNSATCRQPHS